MNMRKFWQGLRVDGQLHLLACLCIELAAYLFVSWAAIAVALVAAVGKEVYDAVTDRGTAEWHDVVCDLYGIIAGIVIICCSLFVGWLL